MLIIVSCKEGRTIDYIDIDYYNEVYLADSLYIVGEHSKSFEILQNLFDKSEPIYMPLYAEYRTYVKSAYHVNEDKIVSNGLEILISKYGNTIETMKYDSILNLIYSQQKKVVDANYDAWRRQYISNINLKLRDSIKEMMRLDQLYRGKNYSENIEKQNFIDSTNTQKLLKLFKSVGYPNDRKIGNYLVDKTFVDIQGVLLHTNDSLRKNYLFSKILDYVREGQCKPETYARIVDQFHLFNGEGQIYGSYTDGSGGYSPIQRIDKVDSLRKTIGLPRLGYKEWRTNILYPK